ncbi:polyphosphate kinase 2 [Neisseria sp. Ec49-e6-T10]|uniref:polyphosphate kinase 2 n=1 Tax=Neisseria sp. Ec49-e6-T10 TaxID=3140744 RepID=UPI003EBA5749
MSKKTVVSKDVLKEIHEYSTIEHPNCEIKDKTQKIKNKAYQKELKKLQGELVALQEWVKATGQKVCIIFEGRDGAGKGGTIKVLTERVSPRVFHTVALPVPTEREKTQMYLQRYIKHLPAAGEITIFDRSWYNRAVVEPVMGYCTEEESKTFLDQVSLLEKVIVNSGIILLKYWLEINMDEQKRRMLSRMNDPRKTWKLSPNDIKSYSKWYDYSRARDKMIAASDSSWAPWFIADANDKKRARLNILSHILSEIPYEKIPTKTVKLPHRQKKGDYTEPNYYYRWVPEKF